MTTERTPLLADPESLLHDKLSVEVSIDNLRDALCHLLASHNVPPFTACGINPANPTTQRIVVCYAQQLLNCFPDAKTAPSSSQEPTLTKSQDAALYLCALLALLLTLTSGQRNLRTEMKLASARKALCSAITQLFTATVDNAPEEQDHDTYMQLLLSPFPLTLDSDVNMSALDLILQLVHLPKSAGLREVILHPLVSRAVESAWERRLPALNQRKPRSLFLLHYIFFLFYSITAIFFALTPMSAHYFSFNPLVYRWHHSTVGQSFIWYLFAITVLGWTIELTFTLLQGPLPYKASKGLPLPPGSYVALLPHSFLFLFVLLRCISRGNLAISSIAYTFLAWSAPLFLLAILIFPVGLPSLNPASYRIATPRFRALRVVNDRIDVFSPMMAFILISLAALFWAVNGEVERYDPKVLIYPGDRDEPISRTVSPIEVRSSLAVGFLAVCLLGWLMGDAVITADPSARLAEIETAAQLERCRTLRYFSPSTNHRGQHEAVPIPSPFNLLVVPLRLLTTFGLNRFQGTNWQEAEVSRGLVSPVLRGLEMLYNRP